MPKKPSKRTKSPFDGKAYDRMMLGFRSHFVYQSLVARLEWEVNEMAAGGGKDAQHALDLQEDLRRLAQYRAQYLTGEHGVNVDDAIETAIRVGARAQALGIERLVDWENRRKTHKQTADKMRAAVSDAKAARAKEMYREWYLDLPKSERPKKADVEANIAHRLNIEFPGSPTKPRTVRFYLASKNSENF